MEGGVLTPRTSNAASLAVVVALHGAAITALALSKMDLPIREVIPPLIAESFEMEPIPPEIIPEPEPVPQPRAAPRSEIVAVDPVVETLSRSVVEAETKPAETPPFLPGPVGLKDGNGDAIVEPQPPVRAEAQVDRRFSDDLQPPYPPSEQRMGNEGTVTVRVTIGTDGRVKAVSRLSAPSDAFYRATERHALRKWRFRPATVDGQPVESRKVMTVHFRIEN